MMYRERGVSGVVEDYDSNDRYAKSCARHACSSLNTRRVQRNRTKKKRKRREGKNVETGHIPKTSTAISMIHLPAIYISVIISYKLS